MVRQLNGYVWIKLGVNALLTRCESELIKIGWTEVKYIKIRNSIEKYAFAKIVAGRGNSEAWINRKSKAT